MSEILRSYRDFEAGDLARQLHESVIASERLLRDRNMLGPIARYGTSLEKAEDMVLKAQSDRDPEHFAVIDEEENVIGAASIYEGLKLGKAKLPLPVGLLRPRRQGQLSHFYNSYDRPGLNISAWVTSERADLLGLAYQGLADVALDSGLLGTAEAGESATGSWAWTIEPELSPSVAHSAIESAGLRQLGQAGRYDDHESGRRVPPKSLLYVMRGMQVIKRLSRPSIER